MTHHDYPSTTKYCIVVRTLPAVSEEEKEALRIQYSTVKYGYTYENVIFRFISVFLLMRIVLGGLWVQIAEATHNKLGLTL